MARARHALVLGALSWALAGCDIYDIGPALAALDASQSSPLELAERCSDEVPRVEGPIENVTIALDDFVDDERTLTGCDALDVDGADGFVRLPAIAEQRWSVLAQPLEGSTDLVLYVMSTCDPSSCTHLLDRCGTGIPESFVFQARSEGEYLLGIDSRGVADDVELTILSTLCGDRRRELGEGCDDGNRTNGDGCDRDCRLEISSQNRREIEPNNWPTEANVLDLATDPTGTTALGRLGGACDADYYVLRLAQPSDVRAVMLDGGELPCDGSTPSTTMALINPDGETRRGEGAPGGAGGRCPSIEADATFAQDLEPGDYFLSVAAERDAPTLDYTLVIEVVPAP